jgi:phospholipid/cholesterol/gamma-HCH transport system substrate-binding protein
MRSEVKIGLLTIVALALMIWGFKFLQGENVFDNTKTYFINYEYVDQLTISSPVLINGFQVGSVTDINMDEGNYKNVVVEITVDGKINIPAETEASLESSGIMGGKLIALYFSKSCNGDDCAPSKSFLKGKSKGLLGSMVDDKEIDNYFIKIQKSITTLFDSLSARMGTDMTGTSGMDKTIEDLQTTIHNLAEMSAKLNAVLDKSSNSINQTVSNLASLSKTLESNNSKIDNIIGNFETVSQDIKDANIGSTLGKTEKAMDEATIAITEIKGTIENVKQAVERINKVVDEVENGEGSLGKLVYDEALYENLNSTSQNLDRLLQDIRLNPKRYVHISVFGKKQADFTLPDEDPYSNQ